MPSPITQVTFKAGLPRGMEVLSIADTVSKYSAVITNSHCNILLNDLLNGPVIDVNTTNRCAILLRL